MSNPEVKAPWAISLAMAFTYIAGFLFTIVLCFVMVHSSFASHGADSYLLSLG